MIKCFIIDDEQPAINVLSAYISQIQELELVGSDTNPVKGIEKIKLLKPDVVFLDIQMNEMNGLDVMQILHKEIKVVFCTAYSQFAVESYDLNAVDYLMKPVSFARFMKTIDRLQEKSKEDRPGEVIPNDYLFFAMEQKGKMRRIDLDDIDYIEGMSNYMAFHILGKQILLYTTMKELEEKLPSSQFMRIHKSYIIAFNKIELIEKHCVKMRNYESLLPISESYRDALYEKIKGRVIRFN